MGISNKDDVIDSRGVIERIEELEGEREGLAQARCGMIAWRVYLRGKPLTTVFYTADSDAEYVRASLINHDNMPPGITVRRAKE